MTLGPPVPAFGPTPCRILLLGEAPGETESERGIPFVGPSGQELRRMLKTIGVELDEVYRTNVFSRRPPGNDVAVGYGTSQGDGGGLGPLTSNPRTFLAPEHAEHLARLQGEIRACNPNVIVALGNTACWALGLGLGINSLRGSVHLWTSPWGRAYKVLPTYHPAAILRQWDLRVVAIADLEKALVESETPDLQFDNSTLWLNPTWADLVEFGNDHLATATVLATDVETKRGQITCLSLCPGGHVSLCVPFWQTAGPGGPHYWDAETEVRVWQWVRRWLEDQGIVKVMQNGMYDVQYFLAHGIRVRNATEDTMLLHHSLYCELQKGLGFLGSVYANVPSWKSMRTAKREELLKRDD